MQTNVLHLPVSGVIFTPCSGLNGGVFYMSNTNKEPMQLPLWFQDDYLAKYWQACGIDADFYTTRGFGEAEVLPWDTVNVGVTKRFLLRERKQAYEGKITPDCREGCAGCGANCLLKEVECDA